jgi:hypothetical protein
MTLCICVACQEPADTQSGDRCGDCREVESRHYADWSDSEAVTDDVWFDTQSVDQTVRADIAEAPSDEEVAAEVARYFSHPVFMTLVYAEYDAWRNERDVSKVPSAGPVAKENEVTEQVVISVSGASR